MTFHRFTRRHLLAGTSIAIAAPLFGDEPAAPELSFPKDAAEALGRLKDGNQRFANGRTRHAHESANWRKQLVGGQKPFATILGCSDSRAPIELVFDQGFGDLFVVRVAGNVIAPDVIGSLAYAVAHLATPLLVLEHQVDAYNLLTRAGFLTRQAVHHQRALNRELGESADHVWESTNSRIRSAVEPLVEYLLFSGEATLTHRIEGTSGFAKEFAERGPRDRRGRSLRDFDLEKRLFKFPCSYLIYSASFQSLPAEAKDRVLRRMWEVLSGQDQSKRFAHLTGDDRAAILEILRDTMADLPPAWQTTAARATENSGSRTGAQGRP